MDNYSNGLQFCQLCVSALVGSNSVGIKSDGFTSANSAGCCFEPKANQVYIAKQSHPAHVNYNDPAPEATTDRQL
eukprot:Pgem_evm1s37